MSGRRTLLVVCCLALLAGGALAADAPAGDGGTGVVVAGDDPGDIAALGGPDASAAPAATATTTDRPPARIAPSSADPDRAGVTYSITVENVAAREGRSSVDQVALDFSGTGLRFDGVDRSDVTLIKNPDRNPEPLVVTKTRTNLAGERPTIGVSRASGQPRVTEGDTLRVVVEGLRNPAGGEYTAGVRLNELATGDRAGPLDARHGTFTISSNVGSVSGTVTDASGDPVTSEVTVTDGAGNVLGTATPDADGSYTLEGVREGTYDLTVSAPGYEPTTVAGVDVVAGEETGGVDAALDPVPAVLTPEVETAEEVVAGDPIEVETTLTNHGAEETTQDVTVTVTEVDGDVVSNETRTVTVGADESSTETTTVETADLPPGEYVVEVRTEDGVETVPVTVGQPAFFDVTVDDETPAVDAGETLSVTATIANEGDVAGEKPVTLAIGGEVVDETTVTLAPTEETDVTLDWATTDADAGVHDATVASPDDEDTTTVSVRGPAAVAVNVTDGDATVVRGDTATVTASVTNPGDEEATESVALVVDGEVVDAETVTLAGGESAEVTLGWNTTDAAAGEHDLVVQSASGGATHTVEVLDPAAFDVAVENATDADAGDVATVTARVTNTGDVRGTEEVVLRSDDAVLDRVTVELDPGESEVVELRWDTADAAPGVHAPTVETATATARTPVRVRGPGVVSVAIDAERTPAAVASGADLPVTATVTNEGRERVTRQVGLVADGRLVASERVTLASGESAEVTLTWETAADPPGNYTLDASAGDRPASHDARLLRPAVFDTTIDATTSPVETGEPLTVETTVANDGEAPAKLPVTLTADGDVVDAELVALDGGERTTVTLDWDTTGVDAGTYAVEARGPDPVSQFAAEPVVGTADVEVTGVETETPPATPTATPEPAADSDCELFGIDLGGLVVCWYWWLLGGLVVAGGVGYWMLREG